VQLLYRCQSRYERIQRALLQVSDRVFTLSWIRLGRESSQRRYTVSGLRSRGHLKGSRTRLRILGQQENQQVNNYWYLFIVYSDKLQHNTIIRYRTKSAERLMNGKLASIRLVASRKNPVKIPVKIQTYSPCRTMDRYIKYLSTDDDSYHSTHSN